MGSTSRDTREKQQLQVEAMLSARIAALDAAGVKEGDRKKDPTYRKLKAEAKQAKRRLTAMAEQEALVQKALAEKAGKAEAKAAEKAAKKAARKAGEPAPGKAGDKPKKAKKAKPEGAEEEKKPKKAPKEVPVEEPKEE